MSGSRRRRKAEERRRAASPYDRAGFYRQHRADRPWCKYGDEPHFVPPCLGDPGFYMCDADKPAAAAEEGAS